MAPTPPFHLVGFYGSRDGGRATKAEVERVYSPKVLWYDPWSLLIEKALSESCWLRCWRSRGGCCCAPCGPDESSALPLLKEELSKLDPGKTQVVVLEGFRAEPCWVYFPAPLVEGKLDEFLAVNFDILGKPL